MEIVPTHIPPPMCTGVEQMMNHGHRGARLEIAKRRRWGESPPVPSADIFQDIRPWNDRQEVRQ